MTRVCGLVLCGGQSARMGHDKALAEFDGVPMLARALTVLDGVCSNVLLACGPLPRYGDFGRELVLDAPCGSPVGLGPLAGLAAGLCRARDLGIEWALVLACDLPLCTTELVCQLLEHARRERADVCLLELERGTQPLLGVYRSAVGELAQAAVARGDRRMVSFHSDRLGGRSLRLCHLRAQDARASLQASNVNTPEDLARLAALEKRSA